MLFNDTMLSQNDDRCGCAFDDDSSNAETYDGEVDKCSTEPLVGVRRIKLLAACLAITKQRQ
jgi:hypothetical protein